MKNNDWPEKYPLILQPYSYNLNGHFGVLNFYNKYSDKRAVRDSFLFLKNYLIKYFKDNMNCSVTENIMNYIEFIIKCFTVSWDVEDECFIIKMKKRKDDHRMPVFDKEEFFKKSMDIGLSKNLSKTFLKNLLKDTEKNYNNYV